MLHPKMRHLYIGIDSHKDTHCAVVLNCFFEKLGEITFLNVPSEFEGFLNQILKLTPKGIKPAFGLEDTSSYGRSLTVFLNGKKQVVKHVNASLVASERRSRNVLHKTDSEDAECAARVLLSRFDQLPDADPEDKYWVLSNIVTRRKGIVKTNVALKNQLHAFITVHYPSYNRFFVNIDSATALMFYEMFPSPAKLEGTTAEELGELLADRSNRRLGIQKALQILNCVEMDGRTTSAYQEVRDSAVQSIIHQINSNLQEIDSIDALLEGFLDKFDYNLTSMSGIDTVTAASLIAEIGDIRRFPSAAKLAKYAGVAPVTYSSGRTDVQYANQRGNRELNSIFFRLAVRVTMTTGKNQRIINPFFYEYYNRKLAEGKTTKQALKCVERRLVNIIWGMMTHNEPYINPPSQAQPKSKQETVS